MGVRFEFCWVFQSVLVTMVKSRRINFTIILMDVGSNSFGCLNK